MDLPIKRRTDQSIFSSSDLQMQPSTDPAIYKSIEIPIQDLQILRNTDPAIYRSSAL